MTDKLDNSCEVCSTESSTETLETEWCLFDSADELDELSDGWHLFDTVDDAPSEGIEAENKNSSTSGKGRPAVMADANYYNKALWKIVQLEGGVLLESVVSGRYLFDSTPGIASEGAHVADKRCQDGGWGHEGIKPAVMADVNYHNKALWKIVQHEACVLIESVETGRYLFDSAPDGHVGDIRCQDGGWIHENIKPALMADANYYNRALWKIVEHEGGILIESVITGRYLFDSAPDDHVGDKRGQDGGWINEEVSEFNKMIAKLLEQNSGFLIESVVSGRYLFDSAHGVAADGVHVGEKRGQEGGWVHNNVKPALMSDANYNNKALWKIVKNESDCFVIESVETGRCLFDSAPDGHVGDKRCQDGGWIHKNIKPALMADANYYNRALWKIVERGEGVLIESAVTGRYLFDSAPDDHVGEIRGQECGWVHKNVKPAVMADANYYNKALWKIVMQ